MDGGYQSRCIRVTVTLYDHAPETNKAGPIMQSGIHTAPEPLKQRRGKKPDKPPIPTPSEGQPDEVTKQLCNTLAGFQGNVTNKSIAHDHIRHTTEKVISLNIANIMNRTL
jgi:hypothetical protein